MAQSHPAFAYPNPDLSSLQLVPNLAKIGTPRRRRTVLWPEFSWQTDPGREDSRGCQTFAPDISRLGHGDEGRVCSIICPREGICTASLGCLNFEVEVEVAVTVTGQRGWVDEPAKSLAPDMTG